MIIIWFPLRMQVNFLLLAEQKFSVYENKVLAAIFGMEKFYNYLESGEFELHTDNQALNWFLATNNPASRLARRLVHLTQFRFNVKHIKLVDNGVALIASLPDCIEEQPAVHHPTAEPCPRVVIVDQCWNAGVGTREIPKKTHSPSLFSTIPTCGNPEQLCQESNLVRRVRSKVWRADKGEVRQVWSRIGKKWQGKREITEKIHQPAESAGTIPTLRNSRVNLVHLVGSRVIPGFSHVETVPDNAAGRLVFSSSPVSPTLSFWYCSMLASITLVGSQDLSNGKVEKRVVRLAVKEETATAIRVKKCGRAQSTSEPRAKSSVLASRILCGADAVSDLSGSSVLYQPCDYHSSLIDIPNHFVHNSPESAAPQPHFFVHDRDLQTSDAGYQGRPCGRTDHDPTSFCALSLALVADRKNLQLPIQSTLGRGVERLSPSCLSTLAFTALERKGDPDESPRATVEAWAVPPFIVITSDLRCLEGAGAWPRPLGVDLKTSHAWTMDAYLAYRYVPGVKYLRTAGTRVGRWAAAFDRTVTWVDCSSSSEYQHCTGSLPARLASVTWLGVAELVTAALRGTMPVSSAAQ
ncbi:hypothetical protein PR048_009237 [Dryococelus australis]|uniref:Reverse transcriptase RNase H-like domain-containing protein n=1 Tax=Dryococelus australis TaxID=614101 RepID=A0ABQ9HZB7_9NEOP|nr:hypothetical protein PR048_009237 [Dryococelus australis]